MSKYINGRKLFVFFNTIGLILLSLIFLLPVWHVAMGSISDPLLVSANSGLILKPLGQITMGGYRLVMQNNLIVKSYVNTIIYVISATSIGLVLNILAAYVLSRKNLYFKGIIVFIITFTMIFNGGLIPTYMLIRNLGFLDTRWAIILPTSLTAYNIIVMRTSFASIP